MLQFNIHSGFVNLTDPCYNTDTWCGAYKIPARTGRWNAEIAEDDDRVASFTVFADGFSDVMLSHMSVNFGVDSGQFGIFDSDTYVGDSDADGRKWYFDICELTNPCCIIPDSTGFCSSSGYGDGSYEGFSSYDEEGKLVKFRIEFITEEEDEEED
jgi:hypothetical protein